jgi:hypothetical protein
MTSQAQHHEIGDINEESTEEGNNNVGNNCALRIFCFTFVVLNCSRIKY